MKRIVTLITALTIFAVGLTAVLGLIQKAAAKEVTSDINATASGAESEIRAILEKYYEIARTNDREALMNFSRAISAPEYQFTSERGTKNKNETFRFLDSKTAEFLSAGFENLTVQVHGETAIAKYRDVSTLRINGDVLRAPVHFTNVWVKRGDRWLIVAEHSSQAAPPNLLQKISVVKSQGKIGLPFAGI